MIQSTATFGGVDRNAGSADGFHEAGVQTIPLGSGFLIGALQRQLDRHVRRGADHTWATVGVAVAHQGFQEQDEFLG